MGKQPLTQDEKLTAVLIVIIAGAVVIHLLDQPRDNGPYPTFDYSYDYHQRLEKNEQAIRDGLAALGKTNFSAQENAAIHAQAVQSMATH